jgi:hypothetical protein
MTITLNGQTRLLTPHERMLVAIRADRCMTSVGRCYQGAPVTATTYRAVYRAARDLDLPLPPDRRVAAISSLGRFTAERD